MKNNKSSKCTQSGMSFISLIFVLAMSLFTVTTIIKILPIYIENFSVTNSLESIANEIDEKKIMPKDIKEKLIKRLDSNNITGINKDNIMISGGEDHSILSIQYEVRKPILGNLDVIMTFSNSQAINL